MRTVLYITYDGLTDPLGQSQILAYLKKLGSFENRIVILSFEKRDLFLKESRKIKEVVNEHGLRWVPLKYTKKPPIISTILDLIRGYRACRKLFAEVRPEIVHCRGYMAAILGRRLKQKYGLKFIFDMRGWWPDEKLESGFWDNPIYKPVYRYFKEMERIFFKECDFAVSLTHRGKVEIEKRGLAPANKIGVIPTCVDFEIFKPRDISTRAFMRQKLGIHVSEKVFIYSGSLGGNYEVDILISAFKAFRNLHSKSFLLVLSKDNVNDQTIQNFSAQGIDRLAIHNAPFLEVTNYLQAADAGFIYYRRSFSTIGRSPTKLAEYWASGLPVIALSGIGDLDYIFDRFPKGGVLLSEDKNRWEVEIRATQFGNCEVLRHYAEEYFDVDKGVEFYESVYDNLVDHNTVKQHD